MVNKDTRDTDSKDGREIGLVELRRGVLVLAMPIFGLAGGFRVLVSLYDVYKEWARVTPAPALMNP